MVEVKTPEQPALAKKAVQDVIDLYTYIAKHNGIHSFDEAVMRDLRLIEAHGQPGDHTATPPKPPTAHPTAIFELDVTSAYTNLNNVMHGGAISTIFDMTLMLAMAPVHRPGYWEFMAGTTRILNSSFIRAVPTGTTVRIRNEVLQHGRTMAAMRGTLESIDGKTVYATCEQHKVHVPTLPEHVKLAALLNDMKVDKEGGKAKL